MNWMLVGLLAVPGILMGLLSVRGHTRGIELYLWIILGIFAALVIARTAGSRCFLHGFCVGIAWGVLNGLTAAALFSTYMRHNPEVARLMRPGDSKIEPQVMFLLSAPVIGLATGIVLGLVCWGATHMIKPALPIVVAGSAPAMPDDAEA